MNSLIRVNTDCSHDRIVFCTFDHKKPQCSEQIRVDWQDTVYLIKTMMSICIDYKKLEILGSSIINLEDLFSTKNKKFLLCYSS